MRSPTYGLWQSRKKRTTVAHDYDCSWHSRRNIWWSWRLSYSNESPHFFQYFLHHIGFTVSDCIIHTSQRNQERSKSEDPDSIVVSELHHPDLRDSGYSNSVLWCSIVNKSDAIVTINNVRAYDSADRLLPTAWSNGLKDDLGNLSDFTGLLAIKAQETSSIYLRHLHMIDIFICRIEIYHSLSDKPIIKNFDDTKWES